MIKADHVFICFGLGRSGHHAIMYWLRSHYPIEDVGYVQRVRIKKGNIRQQITIDRFLRRTKLFSKIFLNLESAPLLFTSDVLYSPKWETFNVIILRDLFNSLPSWFASNKEPETYNMNQLNKGASNYALMWKEYAHELLGNTNNLRNKILIKFNNWFKSEKYRSSISNILKLKPLYDTVNTLANRDIGSSFDGDNYHDCAQQMKVLERWKHHIPFCKKHIDNEVIDLSKQIFGTEFVEQIITSKEWNQSTD